MLDTIPAWVADELTPWSIVFIIILLILTGGLHTNWAMKRMERELGYWRDAFMTEQKTNRELSKSIEKQEVASETVEKFIADLQKLQRQHDDGGDSS